MNTKRKGSSNEHRSIMLLESSGYACTRAAGSLGTFDVIGVSSSDIILLQVKSNSWQGAAELEVTLNFQCPPLCKKIWRDQQRRPDVRTV